MDSVVHFEIPANDVKRAGDFYKKTFGWMTNSLEDMGYTILYTTETDMKNFMIKKVGAINGGMMKRNEKIKNPVITLSVDNMEEAFKKVKANGGSVYIEKMPVGDMGFAGYIKDTEGNIIGLFEPSKNMQET